LIPGTVERVDISAPTSGLNSVLPVARRLRLRRAQGRIDASHERIEPVRLGPGPLESLLLVGREPAKTASSVLDCEDELGQALRAQQLARRIGP
jgi:hypothetical protein